MRGGREGKIRNLRLTIQYVGTRYRGWQSQPGGRTVQDLLEGALGSVVQERVRLTGAGRTDAGVHARGQVANFHTATRLETDRILQGGNALLPSDIRILGVQEVPGSFHACRDAVAKEYRYRMGTGPVLSPFLEPFVHQVRGPFRIPPMKQAARWYLGEHDFTSFCATGSTVRDRVRRVFESTLEMGDGEEVLTYRVSANGFLQHMVRSLVGTLIEVGRGRTDPDRIPEILAARDRRAAGPCAPAKGLILEIVVYPEIP